MENTGKGKFTRAFPQNKWYDSGAHLSGESKTPIEEFVSSHASHYEEEQEYDERMNAIQNNYDDPDDDEEEEEDDDASDWGHTDPTDSPFPDSNDPSGPGSAV